MEELIKELFQKKTEDQHLDYKESFNWEVSTNPIRGEIIKDIISFFNVSDGGKILIGVRNETFEPVGMKKEDFDSFDTTKVNQFLEKYTDPTHFCKVHKVIIDGKYFVLIDCPEFSDIPILTIKDLHGENNKRVLIANALYYRNEKGESTVISSSQDFRDLISRSLRKKKQALLFDIEAILTGHQPQTKPTAEAQYQHELENFQTFFDERVVKPSEITNFGFWYFQILPTSYSPSRIPETPSAAKLVKEASVSFRGWDFPHTDTHHRDGTGNFSKGFQSVTIESFTPHLEAYRIYQSGLFIWKAVLKEELTEENDKKYFYYVNAIYQMLEFFLFAARYAEALGEESYSLKIELHGIEGRQLYERRTWSSENHKATDDSFVWEKQISKADLLANYRQIAAEAAVSLMHIFNFDECTVETIAPWFEKYLSRRF